MKISAGAVSFLMTLCFCVAANAWFDLKVKVNPSQPVLITTSSKVGGKTTGPSAPYVTLNNLTIEWKGKADFHVLQFFMRTMDENRVVTTACPIHSQEIANLFYNSTLEGCENNGNPALNADGQLIIPGVKQPDCTVRVKSSAFFCDGLNVRVNPDPFHTYNIKAEFFVVGQELKSGGRASRSVAKAKVVIH